MLKRKSVILIAGGLLGTQVTAAAAADQGFPASINEVYGGMTPALIQYLEQRAAANPAPSGAKGSVWPFSAGSVKGASNPDQDRYLAERARSISVGPDTVKINGSTQTINVEHLRTIRIENDKGQSFVWRADVLAHGVDHFALRAVAPGNFDAGRTQVFLTHPHEHMLHN
jgi:hypothetical protein